MKSIIAVITVLFFVNFVVNLGNANSPENGSSSDDEDRAVLSQFLWELYKDRKFDQQGREIIGQLTKRFSGELPTNEREWIEYYKENLKLTEELAPSIENPILRKALENRNQDTEKLIKKLESGEGTQEDIDEYNARTIEKLREALEEYDEGRDDTVKD